MRKVKIILAFKSALLRWQMHNPTTEWWEWMNCKKRKTYTELKSSMGLGFIKKRSTGAWIKTSLWWAHPISTTWLTMIIIWAIKFIVQWLWFLQRNELPLQLGKPLKPDAQWLGRENMLPEKKRMWETCLMPVLKLGNLSIKKQWKTAMEKTKQLTTMK